METSTFFHYSWLYIRAVGRNLGPDNLAPCTKFDGKVQYRSMAIYRRLHVVLGNIYVPVHKLHISMHIQNETSILRKTQTAKRTMALGVGSREMEKGH